MPIIFVGFYASIFYKKDGTCEVKTVDLRVGPYLAFVSLDSSSIIVAKLNNMIKKMMISRKEKLNQIPQMLCSGSNQMTG